MTPSDRKPRREAGESVWDSPNNLGFAEQLRGLGGTVAPVLAGFSLAAIVTLVTADAGPPLADWALVAFVSAAVLLLMTMQLSSQALGRSAPPSVHLDWQPLARVRVNSLTEVREQQRADMATVRLFWRRAGVCYDLGLISFLAGVLMLVVPEFWSLERVLAVGATGAALAVELRWSWNTWRNTLRHPIELLVKRKDPDNPPDLDEWVLAAVLDRSEQSDQTSPNGADATAPTSGAARDA